MWNQDHDMARKAVPGLLAGARANSGCLQQMPHAQLKTHEKLTRTDQGLEWGMTAGPRDVHTGRALPTMGREADKAIVCP